MRGIALQALRFCRLNAGNGERPNWLSGAFECASRATQHNAQQPPSSACVCSMRQLRASYCRILSGLAGISLLAR